MARPRGPCADAGASMRPGTSPGGVHDQAHALNLGAHTIHAVAEACAHAPMPPPMRSMPGPILSMPGHCLHLHLKQRHRTGVVSGG